MKHYIPSLVFITALCINAHLSTCMEHDINQKVHKKSPNKYNNVIKRHIKGVFSVFETQYKDSFVEIFNAYNNNDINQQQLFEQLMINQLQQDHPNLKNLDNTKVHSVIQQIILDYTNSLLVYKKQQRKRQYIDNCITRILRATQ